MIILYFSNLNFFYIEYILLICIYRGQPEVLWGQGGKDETGN